MRLPRPALPRCSKNRDRKRDPEMRSTKKGNQWYFGMKAHVATDLQGIVQAVDFTAAKVPDNQRLEGFLTGEESVVLADRGYDYPQVHDTLAARGIRDAVARRVILGRRRDWRRSSATTAPLPESVPGENTLSGC